MFYHGINPLTTLSFIIVELLSFMGALQLSAVIWTQNYNLHSDINMALQLQNVTKQKIFIGQIAAASCNLVTQTTNIHPV